MRFLRERFLRERFFLVRLPPLFAQGHAIYYIYLYFGPRTFLPRNFLEVLGIRPLAFSDAVAVKPMDSPFLRRRKKFLFFLVALYPPSI